MLPLVPTVKHHVASLGADVIGEADETAQLALFRGIPYATAEKRWTHSRTKNDLESPFDATSFGPRCVQGHGEILVSGGVNDPTPGDHEFDCLNLNVTAPAGTLSTDSEHLLPVMVWIHGGAFHYGANSVARYRPTKLCSMAAAAGTPIILVQIGYRLGPLGFAASNDLASEASKAIGNSTSRDDIPSTGSYGLVDQRNALQWVQNHIRGFGGDPQNVTAFGVSAGSASVHFHILTGAPLFDRAIMMSGAASTLGPLPFELYEKQWEEMCKKLLVDKETPEARLTQLRSLPAEHILENYSKAAMGPWGDGTYLPASWTFSDVGPSRCKAIILGDTRVEAIILDSMFKAIPQLKFRDLVRSCFSAEDTQSFAKAFGFYLDSEQSLEDYIQCMRHFFSVMMFQYPNIGIVEVPEPPYEAYLYHFEEPSPYPGPTQGVPYHGQCALYMHNNDAQEYPASGKRVAEEMATLWTTFAHGRQPWEPYSKAQRFMRFGPGSASTLQSIADDNTRDYAYLDWLRDHFEQAKTLARLLLQGEGRGK